ncbi:MAG TPA: hemerythrin domain-containing protein [Burkholderiaceae bacterium]|nr:hemerythrin domain-containing protein [Burkholderiaceae bacterium]
MKPLLETVPGFDQPIAVLRHCHDRIRKQLRTLEKLLTDLPVFEVNIDARQGANAVLQYFGNAAPNHHADEEKDLLPMLQVTATGEDATLLAELIPQIMEEHVQMEAAWQVLERQLRFIASGESSELSARDVKRFVQVYSTHMEKEEAHLAPMAKRLFNEQQMIRLGNAMRTRRGLSQ